MSNDPTASPVTDDLDPIHNPTTNTAADHDDTPDKDAELARWKAQSRENEKRAKANAAAAKELEELKAANMTELERAKAEAAAAVDALRQFGATRVDDKFRVAAAGRTIDIDALLDGLDRQRFVDDNGQPDGKRIAAYVDAIAPPADETPFRPRVPAGVRDTTSTKGDPVKEFTALINSQLQR